MKKEIRYSHRAQQEQIELLEYLLEKFGRKTAKKVYQDIEKSLQIISENPEAFKRSSKHPYLHKCVFSKQTSIYYRVNEEFIEIISFRPNRKNPKSFKP